MVASKLVEHRRTLAVLAMVFATLLSAARAHAQRSLENLVEPTRFALVVGNANYAESGNLMSLGSPCSDDPNVETDSKAVADALRSAKWHVEHLCNLKTSELRTKIKSFNRRVQLEYPAFGIIYFSGHGAQVAGTNYLFGVDANINEQDEFKIFDQNPYARLFLESAISLDVEMLDVQPLWGKAVVVFVDACRTNPILNQLRQAGVLTTFPAVASEPDNVLYSFATRAGQAAPDGGLGGISRFARLLSATIKGHSPDTEEIDQLLSAVGTQVVIDSNRQQFTGRAGMLQRPPRFCIKGCGAPADYWKSLKEQFGKPKAAPNSHLDAVAKSYPSGTQQANTTTQARLFRMSLPLDPAPKQSLNPLVAQQSSVSDPAMPTTAPASSQDAALTRSVRFDILYCAGDSATEERARKSEAIRSQLLRLRGVNSPVGGFETGEVRLVAVPPAVNQSLYRASDTVLVFNRDSPAQRAWATSLQSSFETPLRLQEKPGVASDYIRILVCDGAISALGPTIYMQAANQNQLQKASLIGADLAQRLPSARVVKDIEVVKKSPNETEVRYFTLEDQEEAGLVARSAGEFLNKPVRARLIRGYEAEVQGNRLIEVWIGKKESP